MFVVGKMMAPKDIHVLIPGICEYVVLHGKGDFADLIKATDLELEKLSCINRVVFKS